MVISKLIKQEILGHKALTALSAHKFRHEKNAFYFHIESKTEWTAIRVKEWRLGLFMVEFIKHNEQQLAIRAKASFCGREDVLIIIEAYTGMRLA